MPKLEQWAKFPKPLREHLIERMADRSITIEDLNRLRRWVESDPDVPLGEWCKDFGSFKLCGEGSYPKTQPTKIGTKNPKPVDLVPQR